jgi:hypothetical protein
LREDIAAIVARDATTISKTMQARARSRRAATSSARVSPPRASAHRADPHPSHAPSQARAFAQFCANRIEIDAFAPSREKFFFAVATVATGAFRRVGARCGDTERACAARTSVQVRKSGNCIIAARCVERRTRSNPHKYRACGHRQKIARGAARRRPRISV